MSISLLRSAPALAVLVAGSFTLAPALAAAPAAKGARPAVHAKAKSKGKAAAAPAALVIPDAGPEQAKAAEMVYYGAYDCEFQQTVNIAQNPAHASADVRA